MRSEALPILTPNPGAVRAYSRSSFDTYLPNVLEDADPQQAVFALVMLEIDHFKSINDAFGYLRGDAAIREFAERIQATLRPQDLLFRYGGDEFILLLPQTDRKSAQAIAQRTIEQIKRQPFAGDPPLTISVSGGMAMFPADAQVAEALFACADRRCRRAKQTARGQLVVDDNQFLEDEPWVKQPSRLLERDQELEKLHRFLDGISHNSLNILQITGQASSGKSRFMAEAREAARLHGFAMLEVRGRPGLNTRVFGALADARLGWREVLVPELGVEAFVGGLRHIVGVADHRGMVITVEDMSGVDRTSLEFLREVILTGNMKQLALIYADDAGATGDLLGAENRPTAHIELAPLSLSGLQVWVRHSLYWEAPPSLIEWLWHQTGGLPAQIERVLQRLVEGNLLRRHGKGWTYPPDLTSIALGATLLANAPPAYTNLPQQPANFIGREQQIRALHELLHKKPLVTIVGPGGIGKTRLAIQVASEAVGAFADGIFFIALAALATIDDLLIALAAALQVPVQADADPKAQLLKFLHNKRALLVFDHFAHRHNAEALLVDLINSAPHVTLLVTTRDQLHLPDQALMELGGLPYPETGDEPQIERYEAVQLFLRAVHHREHGAVGREPSIVQICQLVAGVPLALELAASFTQDMSIAEIALGLEKSLVAFVTHHAHARRNFSLHYHSLLTVFDSFWQSLSTAEQEILGRLSVFQGGFTAHAAHAIAGASSFFLSALAARSYLQRGPQQRYSMHELLRQYSLEWLAGGHFIDAGTKHCHYYAAYTAAAEARMLTQPAVASEFSQELENVRTAWRWAIEQSQPSAMQQICGGLATFYLLRGAQREAKGILQTGLTEIARRPTEKGALYAAGWLRLLRDLEPQPNNIQTLAGYFEPVYA